MFSQFLLGVLLMTCLVMVVLLVQPQPNQDLKTSRLPYLGVLLFLLVAFLALIGGFAIGA